MEMLLSQQEAIEFADYFQTLKPLDRISVHGKDGIHGPRQLTTAEILQRWYEAQAITAEFIERCGFVVTYNHELVTTFKQVSGKFGLEISIDKLLPESPIVTLIIPSLFTSECPDKHKNFYLLKTRGQLLRALN